MQGCPNKTMSVYYDEFDIPDHDCIFSKYRKRSTCGFVSAQFAVVEGGRFIVVIRHTFEMALNR